MITVVMTGMTEDYHEQRRDLRMEDRDRRLLSLALSLAHILDDAGISADGDVVERVRLLHEKVKQVEAELAAANHTIGVLRGLVRRNG